MLSTLKNSIKSRPALFAFLRPIVQIARWLSPLQIRNTFVKRRCWRRFSRNPIITVRQSEIVSRFHAISPKNYWHIYSNRNEMNSYLNLALRPGDTVLDIGGHVGAYTVPIAKFVGPAGHVSVFEPEDEGRAAIVRNLALNSIGNCKVFNFAIGDKDGNVEFFVRPEKDTHSIFEKSNAPSPLGILERKVVEMRSIDSLLKSATITQPQFIKLDVEGAELDALDGMRETIKGVRAIFVECHDALKVDLGLGEPVELVSEKLRELGALRITQTDQYHVLAFFNDAN